MKLIVFLGRNSEGILRDAFSEFGVQEVIVIARDGDTLSPPPGFTTVAVSSFKPEAGEEYLLIANGGTTAQLLPTVKRLVEAQASFEAWDLQREGKTRVW